MDSEAIRVVVVSDVRLYRDGIALALAARSDVTVAGVAGDHMTALSLLDSRLSTTALIDSAMPDASGLIRKVHAHPSGPKVVALTLGNAESEIATYAEAGASGYVTRRASLDDLVQTLRATAKGEFLCTPAVAARLLERVGALAAYRDAEDPLRSKPTARQLKVLRLLSDGLSNKDIARELGIELATVKNHVHNILEKLQLERRGQAAALLHR